MEFPFDLPHFPLGEFPLDKNP